MAMTPQPPGISTRHLAMRPPGDLGGDQEGILPGKQGSGTHSSNLFLGRWASGPPEGFVKFCGPTGTITGPDSPIPTACQKHSFCTALHRFACFSPLDLTLLFRSFVRHAAGGAPRLPGPSPSGSARLHRSTRSAPHRSSASDSSR